MVEIKISLPELPKFPKLPAVLELLKKLPRLPPYSSIKKRPAKIPKKAQLAAAAAIIIAALGGYYMLSGAPHPRTETAPSDTTAAAPKPATLQRGDPPYPTLLPAGKKVNDLGGWTRVSPPGKNPVYAFVDTVSGVRISVSQQPLPPKFKDDTAEQIKQLALGFNATEKVATDNITVYIGTSAEGSQSVILSKSGLLILIKSTAQVPNDQWTSYVNSLR